MNKHYRLGEVQETDGSRRPVVMLEQSAETYLVEKSKSTPTGEHPLGPIVKTLEVKDTF